MRAIVFCGGKGEKIWPYNEKNQKACLPVGTIPNVLRIVEQLERFKIHDIVLLTGYLEKQLRYILRHKEDLSFIFASSENISKMIMDSSDKENDFLIYYGDVYVSDDDFQNLLSSYRENGNSVLLEKYQENFRTIDYICAQADTKVKAFYGRPRQHYVNSRSAGIFAIDFNILQYVKNAPIGFLNLSVGGMPNEEFYFEQCLQMAIEDGFSIYTVYTKNTFVDMDFPWDIMRANEAFCLDVVSKISESKIDSTATITNEADIQGKIIIGKNSFIGPRVRIEGNCIIGDNTIIDNGAIIGANSVIGDNCNIRDYCKVSPNTVIGNHNKIGYLAEITGVTFDRVAAVHACEIFGVVGTNTDIAANCQMGILRFDDSESTQIIHEKRYSGKYSNGIFLGDYVRTGINNMFYPGVKVGINCALGPGLIINKDIPSRKLVLVKQEIIEKDWGPEKYGWS